MTYQLTVTDTTTVLAVTESPVLITEQVTGVQGIKGDTGATGASGVIQVDAGELTNTGTTSAAQLGLATAGTAGEYTKVTTDSFGRITSGTTLSAADVPTLNQNTTGNATTATTASAVPASGITGTTLPANVVTSSLTTVGTIGSGTWQGSDIGIIYGGTGHDYGSPLVGKAVLVTSPTKATNDTTPEAVFRTSAGTIQYFNVEADTTYAFDGMLQLNTKASGSAAASRLSLIYVATGSLSTLTEQSARLSCNTNRSATTYNGSGGANAANTNSDDSLTATAATTYHINFRGFIRTNATTAGRINLGATQSVAGTSAAPDFILGSFMNVYKVGSGATNTLGNWTA